MTCVFYSSEKRGNYFSLRYYCLLSELIRRHQVSSAIDGARKFLISIFSPLPNQTKVDSNKPILPMNLSNLPFFILFFAIVYLSIIYSLLKIAEAQMHNTTKIYPKISHSGIDSKQRVKTP
jgi:hypothetical protein